MSFEVVFEKRFNNANVHRDVDVEQRRQYFLLTALRPCLSWGCCSTGGSNTAGLIWDTRSKPRSKKKDKLVEYQKQLELERASLASDERIDYIARNRTGNGGGGSRSDRDREVGLAFPAVCRYRCDTAERGQEVR